MYFDAVIDNDSGNVVFNGTPEETKNFLNAFIPMMPIDKVHVMDGETLTRFTVEEYLEHLRR